MEILTLEQAIERAAEVLPEGWSVAVHVENGSAWVEAERPDGEAVHIDNGNLCLTELVCHAVRLALDERALEEMGNNTAKAGKE
jgi:hypothetical protein